MNHERRRIFLVESDRHERKMLVYYLVQRGHWVECAGGVRPALARLTYDGFDVLLTDLWQANTHGKSLLSELKERGQLPARVVTISPASLQEGRTLSQAAGCHAHLARPFPLAALEAALR